MTSAGLYTKRGVVITDGGNTCANGVMYDGRDGTEKVVTIDLPGAFLEADRPEDNRW